MPGIVTVTVPPASSALTTLADAKAYLGITGTTDDAFLQSVIGRASAAVATHCGRAFGYQTITEIFRYGAGSYIGPSAQAVAPYGTPLAASFKPVSFSLAPIVSLTIQENTDAALTAGAGYDLDAGAGLAWRLRNGLRSWWGVPTVTAVYTAGYTLPGDTTQTGPALPGDVEECTLALVAAAYLRRGRDPSVILDITEGVGRVGYAPAKSLTGMAIDDELCAMLAPYRLGIW